MLAVVAFYGLFRGISSEDRSWPEHQDQDFKPVASWLVGVCDKAKQAEVGKYIQVPLHLVMTKTRTPALLVTVVCFTLFKRADLDCSK